MDSKKIMIIGLGACMEPMKRLVEPGIIYIAHIKDKEEAVVRKASLAIALAGLFTGSAFVIRRIQDDPNLSLVGGWYITSERTYSTRHIQYPHALWKKTATAGHRLPLKLKVPRGIHRDGHNRPLKQKPTPRRLSGRNGSRK